MIHSSNVYHEGFPWYWSCKNRRMHKVLLNFLKRLLTSTVLYNWDSLLHQLGQGLATSWKIWNESSNVGQTSLQSSSSLRFLEGYISWMARTFSRSRWIPLDVTTNLRNLPLPPSGRTWLGSSSIDAPIWYRIFSTCLLCDRLCHGFSLQYHFCSIQWSCICARGRLYSLPVDMLPLHSSSRRASAQCCSEICILFIFMVYLNLIVKIHPWRTFSQNCTYYQS